MSTSAQLVYEVFDHQKSDLLLHWLKVGNGVVSSEIEAVSEKEGVIVSLRTRDGVHALTALLAAAGISVDSIHGNKKQELKDRAIQYFNEGKLQVLVTTDALARGFNFSGVRYWVQFDFPELKQDYLQRIEMTEAGSGSVLTLVTPKDGNALKKLELWSGVELLPEKVDGFIYDSQPVKVKPPRRPGARARGLKSKPLQNKKPKFKSKRGR